jgi:hypothetical protein
LVCQNGDRMPPRLNSCSIDVLNDTRYSKVIDAFVPIRFLDLVPIHQTRFLQPAGHVLMPLTAVHVRRWPDMFSQILADLLARHPRQLRRSRFLQPRDVRTHTTGTREDQGRTRPQPATFFGTSKRHTLLSPLTI